MIAAINMQWLGVGIAALVVVALLIVVLVRHHGDVERAATAAPRASAASRPAASPPAPPATPAADAVAPLAPLCAVQAGSFLDEPLAHGFEGLGKVAAPATPVSSGPFPVDPFGSHEDIFPVEPAAAETASPAAAASVSATATTAPEPSAAVAAVAVAATAAPAVPAAADEPALLSDIIVTSGSDEVDLADPDVRELLTQLVDDEIALARTCQAQGQALDAILQLTEAEKASAALGLDDRLATVKALLADLQG